MTRVITGIDHVLVGVRDLEAARHTYERLGFTVTPRGRHIGWGTANYCIMFGADYIELIGIVDAGQPSNDLDKFLEARGEGLAGLALAADDADRTYAALKAAGAGAEPPRQLKRLLELPEGPVEPRFTLVQLAPDTIPGARTFVCHHLTPELMRRPDWLDHANGARRIAGLTVRSEDPERAARAYGGLFGGPVEEAAGGAFRVRLGEAVLEVAGVPANAGPAALGLAAMTVEVADLDATAACLEARGVAAERCRFGLRLPAGAACGAGLVFAAPG